MKPVTGTVELSKSRDVYWMRKMVAPPSIVSVEGSTGWSLRICPGGREEEKLAAVV